MSHENRRPRSRIGAGLGAALLLSSAGVVAQEAASSRRTAGIGELHPAESVVDILALDAPTCLARLREESVTFELAEGPDASAAYVRVLGPLDGVRVEFEGRDALHEVIDCRLALVLRGWAPLLRRERVARLGHLSIFRPGARVAGSRRESGHATALAIDLRYLELDDGRVLDVVRDFGDTTRGAAPCDSTLLEADDVSPIRRIVCGAVADGRFQIVVTPHRDEAHANHVHLEIVPSVDWVYLR